MRTHELTDPSSLRSKAAFFQRLSRASRTLQQREELEELSVASMEQAAGIEKFLSSHDSYKMAAKSIAYDERY